MTARALYVLLLSLLLVALTGCPTTRTGDDDDDDSGAADDDATGPGGGGESGGCDCGEEPHAAWGSSRSSPGIAVAFLLAAGVGIARRRGDRTG